MVAKGDTKVTRWSAGRCQQKGLDDGNQKGVRRNNLNTRDYGDKIQVQSSKRSLILRNG